MIMKTFKQILSEADKEQVINWFYHKTKTDFVDSMLSMENDKFNDMTVLEVKTMNKMRISLFIDNLLSMDITNQDNNHLLYAYSYIGFDDLLPEPIVELININELMDYNNDNSKHVTSYAYEFTKQSEILGFLVAETDYTKEHLMYLITDVLYEASFFGYYEESKQEAVDDLETSIKEINDGTATLRSWDELKKSFADIPSLKSTDKEAIALEEKARHAINNYNKYTRTVELHKIIKMIQSN